MTHLKIWVTPGDSLKVLGDIEVTEGDSLKLFDDTEVTEGDGPKLKNQMEVKETSPSTTRPWELPKLTDPRFQHSPCPFKVVHHVFRHK